MTPRRFVSREVRKPLGPMEQIKRDTGLSDLELADVYNAHFKTCQPGPLGDKFAGRLREALNVAEEAPVVRGYRPQAINSRRKIG